MIDLLPNAEQQQIIDSVTAYFEQDMPVSRLRPGAGSGPRITAGQWQDIAALGWFGLGLPEDQGGIGCSVVEEALIAHQFGRYIASPALMGTMLAAHVAAHAGQPGLVERIVAGDCRAGIAQRLPGQGVEPLDGIYHLIDAEEAELVVSWNRSGAGLFARGAFQNISAVAPFDDSVTLERGQLTAAAPLAWVPAATRDLPMTAILLSAAQLAGVAEAACHLAVEYAKIRDQFGQPIGAFQAIKHRCADMAVAAEAARAQISFASLMLASGAPEAAFQVAVAAVLAGQSALANARAGIQIHGGIGFTAECDAHWYLKRAPLLEQLAGTASYHRAALLNMEPTA